MTQRLKRDPVFVAVLLLDIFPFARRKFGITFDLKETEWLVSEILSLYEERKIVKEDIPDILAIYYNKTRFKKSALKLVG